MKTLTKIIITVIFITSVFACKKNNKANLEFTVVTVADSSRNYTNDTTISNFISISYFESKKTNSENFIADIINQDFFAWLGSFLFAEDSVTLTKNNLNDVIATDIKRFIKDTNEDESIIDCETCKHIELSIDTFLLYQNSKIVSLAYSYYQYSGGAHGFYGQIAFNYDKKDGTPVTIDNLSTNIAELTAIAEQAFIKQNGELKDYWFEDDVFFLPDAFYFTEGKITFYYSIYEIASFAAGDITVELNNDDIKHIIDYIE
ncbi:MAG: DUF3298 and DUF4163 domain-containing protein [Prevotellaceae bacterium]|jgi:hypothetical protein|nr:DUF3298 and DUF4163 domain-containing protein [Prevotellaceae bacterium]